VPKQLDRPLDTTATMAPTHVLLETASGYGVFESKLYEEIGSRTAEVQKSIAEFSKFQKMVTLVSFLPFKNAAHALENANDVSEGKLDLDHCPNATIHCFLHL